MKDNHKITINILGITLIILIIMAMMVHEDNNLELNNFLWMMWPTEENRPIIVYSKIYGKDGGKYFIIKDELISTPEQWGVETSLIREKMQDAFVKRGMSLKTRWFGEEVNSSTYYPIMKKFGEGLRTDDKYYKTMERTQEYLKAKLISAMHDAGSWGPNHTNIGSEIPMLIIPNSYAGINIFRILIALLFINLVILLFITVRREKNKGNNAWVTGGWG